MKNHFTLKSLSDLSSEAIHGKEPAAPAIPESSQHSDDPTGEGFREEMHRRYTTPFVSAISYHRWGLNE